VLVKKWYGAVVVVKECDAVANMELNVADLE